MIDVYSWATPNGHKVHIMLEETGLKHRIHGVNIRTGDQFKPEFLKISPNKPHPRHRRPRRARRQTAVAVRVGRDPALPRIQVRQIPARRPARALALPAVADVADGRSRADVRPGQSFPPLRQGKNRLRDRALHQRGQPAHQCARQAPGRGALRCGKRLHPSPTWRSSRGCATPKAAAST